LTHKATKYKRPKKTFDTT